MEKSVMVQLWGKQVVEKKPVNKAAKKGKDTKAIMRKETVKQKVTKRIRQEWWLQYCPNRKDDVQVL